MTSKQLKDKYIKFFKKRGHSVIASASLIPENDPSALFINAGMHPLVPYLLGEKHPMGKKLTNIQRCIRTPDIEEVGNQWHLTFFEMLGNWSLQDYWKKEAITWSFEFLCQELKIPIDKLAVTVFKGDDDAPFDQESFDTWENLGIKKENIYKYGKKEDWWELAGGGPCGPDTEMFYISDKEPCGPDCQPRCTCGKYVEIWNDVFMEYLKKGNQYSKSEIKNVDTGMGVERTVAVLENYDDVYQIDIIKPILDKVLELAGVGDKEDFYQSNLKPIRIIIDHLRAACFILAEGISPSNLDQGYVLRRLIRRAIRYAKKINIPQEKNLSVEVAKVVIKVNPHWPILKQNQDFIFNELIKEEEKFEKTLDKGLREFAKGIDPFILFTTYGFPIEMTQELAQEQGKTIDLKAFEQKMKEHQELSRKGAEKKFKGGLADDSYQTTKLHTAAHLMLAALRKVLGDHVVQKGSNITAERLRFDFSYGEKMTDEQKKQVERIVNEQIQKALPVNCQEMKVEQAEKKGAMGVFKDRYGEKVKVYSIGGEGGFSCEICGGPHVKNTSELGHFKIIKEESSSAGVRRIKAVLE